MSIKTAAQNYKQPRHREIADQLRGEIQDGVYPVGARLPTEQELGLRFEVSRPTIRSALSTLSNEGLIMRRPRTGSIVIATHPPSVLTQQVSSIEDILDYPQTTYRKAMQQGYVKMDHELAGLTRTAPDSDWFHIGMLRFPSDSTTPLCWTDIYVLPRYADVQKHPRHEELPVCLQIADMHGVVIEQADVEIFVGRVPAHLSDALQANEGSPALFVVRRYRGVDGLPFEVTISIHPENRYRYTFQMRRELKPFVPR